MHHLTPIKLSKIVDTSKFDKVLNIHPGYLLCDTTYCVDVISKGRKHSVLMVNGLRNESPAVYHDDDRLLVVEGSALYEVKLNGSHDIDGLNLPHDVRRAVKLKQGILICHMAGCVLASDDLQSIIWSIENYRITDIVWRDGELRAFFGEHMSVLIDPETGRKMLKKPVPQIEDDITNAILLHFPHQRSH